MPIYIYAWICVHSYSILAAMNQTKNSMSDQKKKKPRTLSPYLAIVLDFFDLYPWLQSIVLIWAELSYSVSLKVNDELNKYSANISGVPYYVVCDESSTVLVLFTSLYIYWMHIFVIEELFLYLFEQVSGKHKLSGGQPTEAFLRAFEAAAN